MPFLTELLAYYDGALSIEGNADTLRVYGICIDSRKAKSGDVFFAIAGTHQDGAQYAMHAVERGAIAVVLSQDVLINLPPSIVRVRVSNVRVALSQVAAALYAPAPKHIAAITGTDGKTSTADFLRQLWEMDGDKAASIGTLGVIGHHLPVIETANTTPDAVSLMQTLHTLAKEGCNYVAMEASSHGLHQYRLDGVKVQAAAFTNLTRDHLDYHGTIEAYFQAKARLFSGVLAPTGTAVLNADDPKFRRLKEICAGKKIITYGYHGVDYKIKRITPKLDGLAVQADIAGTPHHFMLNVIGDFNVMNALAALGLYVGCGGDFEAGIKHIPHLHSVRGRVEKVATHPEGAPIFVDYAHTPAALGNVLKTMRAHTKGKLWVVFGCGGDRDTGKRPEMAKVAVELADEIIVTDDNPRSESPEQIRKDILIAAPSAKNIGDRAEAIAVAIKSLGKDDMLLIAGKGHENTQIVGDKILPFNDAEVARYAVKLCEQKV